MNYLAPILILAALVGVTLFFVFLRKKKKADNAWKKSALDRALDIIKTTDPSFTHNGIKVHFEKGADPATMSFDPMDRGVEHTFAKGECAGYTVDRHLHPITITVFNSEPDSQGDPCYREYIGPNTPYFNSEWDKEKGKGQEVDHYILVAGEMIGAGEPKGDMIVIPHHVDKEDHLETIVCFEMEHCLLCQVDGPLFEETKTHGFGHGHPILSECPGAAVSLVSRPFTGLCGGASKVVTK